MKNDPQSGPGIRPIDLLVERHRAPLEESVEILLKGVPEEGGSVSRAGLERILRAAFEGGLVAAYNANKFARPCGVKEFGLN